MAIEIGKDMVFRIFCDECGEQIIDRQKANVAWHIESEKFSFVHWGCDVRGPNGGRKYGQGSVSVDTFLQELKKQTTVRTATLRRPI